MGQDAQGRPFAILLALVAASLILVIVGFVLRGRGRWRLAGRCCASCRCSAPAH